MENRINENPVETAPALTLTEEDLANYLSERVAAGLKATAAEKYRSHLQHLCKWLPDGAVLTRELLLEWRAELEGSDYSKVTIESYVKDVNSYTKYRGRPDLNIKKTRAYDIRGKQFGYLTAIEPTGEKRRKDIIWRCKCRCGNEIEVYAGLLVRGNTTSCGCLNMEILQHRNRYEEGTELRQSMEEKIRNPNSQSGYVGVQPHRGKWSAHITYKKKHYYLGTFSKIEDAIKARARAKEAVMEDAARIYEETDHHYGEAPRRLPPPPKEDKASVDEKYHAKRNDNTSGYTGVKTEGKRWKAELSFNGTRYHLGLYDDFEQAVQIRKTAEALALAGDEKGIEAMSISFTTYKVKKAALAETSK